MQQIVFGSKSYHVQQGENPNEVSVNEKILRADVKALGNGHYSMLLDGRSVVIEVIDPNTKSPVVKVDGRIYNPQVKDETDLLLERLGMNIKAKKEVKELKAPMPGLVLDIRVQPGQTVKEGDALIVLEAMKMENVLKAPADVTVKSIAVNAGEAIDKNTLLISFE